MGFKIGYWYRKHKNFNSYFFIPNEWFKCSGFYMSICKYKMAKLDCFAVKYEYHKYFEESKYNPEIKKKLRIILDEV